MREIKYKAWIKEGHPQNKNTMVKVLEIDFEEQEIVFKTKASENIIEMGGSDTVRWCTKFDRVEMLQFTGLTDRNGVEIYEGDIIKWNTGIGYIKYRADDYTLGFEVEVIAGSNFYGYEGEHYDWTCVEVIGNIYEGDLINKYKYGVTASFKPVSRESAKKKFVNAVKRGWYHKGDWVPTQAHIPERIGIRMQDVVTELRDELVKEGKIIQDPAREWMCRVEESPELLEKEES
jgi:uncharacterized phage protein (TIGR01671 family)